jgi:threonine dehydratase
MHIDPTLFLDAFDTIDNVLEPSPLVKNIRLSQKYNANIYLKLENMLPVGSFKMRGAIYKLSKLNKEEKKRGVLAVSAGNHAQGVAWAARHFGVKATIIMPEGSPLIKIKNTEALGAKVILHGANVEEGFEYAVEYQKKHKQVFVHPFKDPFVIAGQGSIGFELGDQIDHIDYLFGSIGGGGMMAGVGAVVREKFPKTKIIGAQASGASNMVKSLNTKKLVKPSGPAVTFADGIKVNKPNQEMYELLASTTDIAMDCPDDEIAIALLELMETAQTIAEGAGALPLAAFKKLYAKNPKKFFGKNIVLIICGGNIDVNLIGRIIDRGLISSFRRARFSIELDDRPGVLSELTGLVSKHGANIIQVIHDNDSPKIPILDTVVELTVETSGREHLMEIFKSLEKRYRRVELLDCQI